MCTGVESKSNHSCNHCISWSSHRWVEDWGR